MSEVFERVAVETVPLGELLIDIRNGLVVEQEKESPGIPITRIETISKGTVDMDRVRYVRDAAGKNLENFWLKKGDILFSHINSDLHLGKTALVLSDAPLLHGMNLLRLRVDSSRLRPKYLHHWLDYCRRTGVFMAIAQHAVNQSSLNQKKITSLEVPLCSIEQQDEIVAEIEKQFSRLDEAVANLQRVKANLKRYKASVLKAAVEGRLVETEASIAQREGRSYETGEQLLQRILEERRTKWAGRGKYKEPSSPDANGFCVLPEGWVWASGDQLTSVITDGEHITPRRTPDGVLLLSARNVLNGSLALEDVDYVPEEEYERIARRIEIQAGDVLLSCSGTVGRSCVVPFGLRFTLVRSVAVLRPVIVLSELMAYMLQSPLGQSQIDDRKTQTAQANLFQGKIRQLVFALPPLVEQVRIVAEVDRYLSIIREVDAEVDTNLQKAQVLKRAILVRVFTKE